MRNRQVKKIIEYIEANESELPSIQWMNFIELSLIKVRKANIKLIHSEIAIAY
jgi:hypothetical protein